MSETWLSKKSSVNLEIPGYICEHILGNKSHNTKEGRYSGRISVYYKSSLRNAVTTVEKSKYGILWMKFDKTMFVFNEDVYICSTYVPPAGSKVINSDDFDFFDQLEIGIEKYSLQGICLIM